MRKIAFLLILSFTVLYPNILENISQTQYKYEQERIKKIEEQKNSSNIIFETKQKQLFNNLIKEEHCFVINDIKLIGKDSYKFQKYLKTSLNKIGFKQGMCLGQQSISVIHDFFGNEILSAGFVTTFVNIPSQNLKSGLLKFEILAGKINNLILNDKNTTKNRATLFTAFGGFKRDEVKDEQNYFAIKNGDYINPRKYLDSSKNNLVFIQDYIEPNIKYTPTQGFKTQTSNILKYISDNKLDTLKAVGGGLADSFTSCAGDMVKDMYDTTLVFGYNIGSNILLKDIDTLKAVYNQSDIDQDIPYILGMAMIGNLDRTSINKVTKEIVEKATKDSVKEAGEKGVQNHI